MTKERENTTSNSGSNDRKPYVKPAWQVEEVFEKAALSCAKADDAMCAFGPIQS